MLIIGNLRLQTGLALVILSSGFSGAKITSGRMQSLTWLRANQVFPRRQDCLGFRLICGGVELDKLPVSGICYWQMPSRMNLAQGMSVQSRRCKSNAVGYIPYKRVRAVLVLGQVTCCHDWWVLRHTEFRTELKTKTKSELKTEIKTKRMVMGA